MNRNVDPLPHIRIPARIASWPLLIVCLVMLTDMTTVAKAREIAAIMATLETDGIGTADQLLTLGDSANRDPALVQSFVQAARVIGRQGHWEKSIALLQRAQTVHADSTTSVSHGNEAAVTFLHTIDLAIASAAMQCNKFDLAIKHCETVITDPNTPSSHLAAAYPLLVKAYQSSSRLDDAVKTLHEAITSDQGRAASQQLADISLALGTACLQQKNATAASLAYQSYLTLEPEGRHVVDAKLGDAWAAALGAESSDAAAAKLITFVEKYSEHRDAPHALRAAATCLDQADQPAQAEVIRDQLLQAYPNSEAASAVLTRYSQSDTVWSKNVRAAFQARFLTKSGQRTAIAIDQVAMALSESLRSSDDALWQATVQWLVENDVDGSQTDSLLKRFSTQDKEPLAEHLVIDLIAKANGDSANHSPAASESACRWAGASERWSMLALAADELGPPNDSARRSVAIDRILAEALMQTQRPADALPWWNWLIDERHATDFATLLRGAESSVAHDEIEIATDRIDAAKIAAGDVAFNRTLIQILSAELSIRRARFDEARDTLTEIVRASEPSPTLRPRAQWLVGETYFMQQRYAEAIDAYRRVDAMDSAGEWAPAALLQAGKAFEKLGRGRDATVCYTALMTRFRDWPHASIAQARLAKLSPSVPPGSPAPVLR